MVIYGTIKFIQLRAKITSDSQWHAIPQLDPYVWSFRSYALMQVWWDKASILVMYGHCEILTYVRSALKKGTVPACRRAWCMQREFY